MTTDDEHKLVVDVLAAAPSMLHLLNDFERQVVEEAVPRFQQYGRKFALKGKQAEIYRSIAVKLALRPASEER